MQGKEKRMIKWFSSALIMGLILFFGFFQAKELIAGPKIEISRPIDGETIDNSLTKIEGRAENIAEIRLNGRKIFVNENGEFEELVLLSYGYNTVTLEVIDKFKRKARRDLKLVLK